MALFATFCVFAVAAALVFVVSFFVPKARHAVPSAQHTGKTDAGPVEPEVTGRPRTATRRAAAGVLVFALVLLFFGSFTTVGTKMLGVKTTFGRPTGSIDNGFHWKAPWENVTELNDAVQTDTYASDGGAGGKQQGGAVGTCVNVRIARQATSCVNVSIRWQIREEGVDYLFRNYKDNDAITDNLILRDLQQAVNDAFVNYDPLGIDTNGQSTNPPLSGAGNSLSKVVLASMQDQVGQWIEVQAINIPIQNFDSSTQDKINQLQQQIALTRVAVQRQQTAAADAQANKAIAASVANDPNVLVSKCLDILKEAVDKGQALPAGFSCFGGTAAVAVSTK